MLRGFDEGAEVGNLESGLMLGCILKADCQHLPMVWMWVLRGIGIKDGAIDFGLSNKNGVAVSWGVEDCRRVDVGGCENQEFGFGHTKFEVHLGHAFGGFEEAVRSATLGLEGGQGCRYSLDTITQTQKTRTLDETHR